MIAFQREFNAPKWASSSSDTVLAARGRRHRPKHKNKQRSNIRNTKLRPQTNKKAPNRNKMMISLAYNDSVVLVQVDDDKEWWNQQDNPYGAKPWPATLYTANYLNKNRSYIQNKTILELGCGTGLVSIVAAMKGAGKVIATDLSPLALSLVQEGWRETMSTLTNSRDSINSTLETRIFDITSSDPLPIQSDAIVVATTMLYNSSLANALARRVAEALQKGAWIIVGDDDTGSIARQQFEAELESLLGAATLSDCRWEETTVKCPELGWTQKHVRILQLNSPLRHVDG
jgi:predicted nicotinamide N-methyase